MRRFLRIAGGLVAILVLGAPVLAMGGILLLGWLVAPHYDTNHPDYAHFDSAFEGWRNADAPAATDRLELAPLNGGNWQVACLIGGYGNPIRVLDVIGATVSEPDRQRMRRANQLPRIGPVEESEAAIAFVDHAGKGHIVHFRNGIGAWAQHFEGCVRKPQTAVALGPVDGASPRDGSRIESFRLQ